MSTNSKTPATGGGAAEKNTTNQPTTASQSPTAKPAETSKPKAEEKTKAKNTQQLFEKAKRLSNCVEKIKSLQDAGTSLDSINLGKQSGRDYLKISDGINTFETNTPALLADVLEYLSKRIEVRTDELEQQLAEIERS